MKTQDLVVYGGVSALGLAGIYMLFFTNVFVSWEGETKTNGATENNFSRLNTRVAMKPVEEHDNKVELYDEDLAKEEEARNRELEQSNRGSQRKVEVNDLTEFLQEGSREARDLREPEGMESRSRGSESREARSPREQGGEQDGRKIGEGTATKARNSAIRKKPSIEKDEAADKNTSKKKRRNDPTFGDEEEKKTASSSEAKVEVDAGDSSSELFYNAVIHGRQVIKAGARVTVRLVQEVVVGNCVLPTHTRLTGVAQVSSQRIHITFVACQKEKAMVVFSLYDVTDNIEGLYVENLNDGQELKQEAAADAVAETTDNLGVPIIGNVLKSAGSKKVNSPSVTLESGADVYLKLLPEKNR